MAGFVLEVADVLSPDGLDIDGRTSPSAWSVLLQVLSLRCVCVLKAQACVAGRSHDESGFQFIPYYVNSAEGQVSSIVTSRASIVISVVRLMFYLSR